MLKKFENRRLYSEPFVAFVFQYDVINDGDQEVQTEIHDGVDPYQFVDASLPPELPVKCMRIRLSQ